MESKTLCTWGRVLRGCVIGMREGNVEALKEGPTSCPVFGEYVCKQGLRAKSCNANPSVGLSGWRELKDELAS